jgi:hypothetical protein
MARRDRPSIMCRVTPTGLAPIGPFDGEILAGFRIGTDVSVEIKQARPNDFNAKYWSVLGRASDNSDWPSARALNTALLLEAKHIAYARCMDGSVVVEPRSLSDFDAAEFEAHYHWAVDYICQHVLVGMDPDDLTRDPRKGAR